MQVMRAPLGSITHYVSASDKHTGWQAVKMNMKYLGEKYKVSRGTLWEYSSLTDRYTIVHDPPMITINQMQKRRWTPL
jgi:hypothetical protein